MFEPRVKNLRRLEEKYVIPCESVPVEKGKILFYGPSNFTRWNPKWDNPRLEDEILMKDGTPACINHGFGGSCAEEQLYYYSRLVRPWEPRALVLSCFGNHAAYGYSSAEIFSLATRILEYARTDFPGIKLFFCDAYLALTMAEKKPGSYSSADEYSELVKHYCEKHPDTTLVQHWTHPGFFTEGGVGKAECIRPDIYVEDHKHFNPAGYLEYKKLFSEVLKDLL